MSAINLDDEAKRSSMHWQPTVERALLLANSRQGLPAAIERFRAAHGGDQVLLRMVSEIAAEAYSIGLDAGQGVASSGDAYERVVERLRVMGLLF